MTKKYNFKKLAIPLMKYVGLSTLQKGFIWVIWGYLCYSDFLGPQEIRLAVSTSGLINFQIYTIVCELYNFPTN
ncbi:unnamed protein product [Staurois parvus]|uniref:Uncharacterized protein n=1 Tax=Staurois parvus TaxID=386267 RepID=A0ABN9F0F1_9NEOB|nr:unnamed protein product [Staurois parvus]